jgi:4-amino-4-deoxy-L-arabinose transferase-like glycosyltransferase
MHAETQNGTSLRFVPRLTQLIAVGWAGSGAFVFLFHYDGWLVPLQFAYLIKAALPTLAFGPHFAEFWRAGLINAGCVAAMLITSFAVGAVAIDRWTPEKNLLAALFSLAAGLWSLSVAILLVGIFSIRSLPFVFLLAGCWLLPAPRRFFHRVGSASERLDGWAKLMLACVIAAALLSLLGAMTPPFEYDELEYHLGAPAEYIKAGRITALPHNFYSNLPQLTEMLYLLGLKTSSGVAAKLLHWSLGLLGAVAVYAVAARSWKREVALPAVALFYCVPFMQDLSETARIDLATTFFAVLAFGSLLGWLQDRRDNRYLWLSALMAGGAVGTKWTAIPVVLLPAGVFVLVSRRSVFLAARYWLLAAAVVLPWLIKNWLFMGNPVYPLLDNVFHSPHWSAEQAALFARKHYASFGWDGWAQFVGLIWRYSFKEPFAVPLLLMTAPLILLLRNVTPSARRAGWLFVAAYAGWFLLTFRPWRFLFPIFPLAAMVGAVALDAVGKWARAVVVAVLLAGLSGMGLNSLVDAENPERVPAQVSFLDYALGEVSREEFIARMGRGTFEPIVWMNRNLPADATVLYAGEARAYYARNRVLWSTAFDQSPLEAMMRQAHDAESLFGLMRDLHITHIYVNTYELNRLRNSYGYLVNIDQSLLNEFLSSYTRPVHAWGPCTVYGLKNPT